MLTIKNKIMLLKLKRLIYKHNKAFIKDDYVKAAYYGKMVEHYITDVLKLEDGVYY